MPGQIGVVRVFDMKRLPVGFGVYRDGFYIQLARQARVMRTAISPRLAIRMRLNMSAVRSRES